MQRSATKLLGMCFEGPMSPVFDLPCLEPGRPAPDGWGLGYYGRGEPGASVHREASPHQESGRGAALHELEHYASSIFCMHIREAQWGSREALANTQPFVRAWGGREWLFTHAGSMRDLLVGENERMFEPVGSTDSESIFCEIMSRIAERRWRDLAAADPNELHAWFSEFNGHGTMTSVLTDGLDMCIYVDRASPMKLARVVPPHGELKLRDRDLGVDLTHRGIRNRAGLIFCTSDLEVESESKVPIRTLTPGSLLVVREGMIRDEILQPKAPLPATGESEMSQSGTSQSMASVSPAGSGVVFQQRPLARPPVASEQTLEVCHRTVYKYEEPVRNSTHLLRLTPIHDRLQEVLFHRVKVSVEGRTRDYEDVFGNQVRRLLVQSPFSEMELEARSVVRVLDTDPLRFKPLHARSSMPLVWMPWQQYMLSPYLLPPELPETQLLDLIEYAMSFARRNSHDLLDTLMDINETLFRDYEYRQGSTSVTTSAYEVFRRRSGVCQDFTNLFICLARLLGVPARYACGYIYTGPKHENQVQSEASHAWVQLYLPEAGWKGFDPTNGILTQTDHVRVAVGRNYLDATPTSGTIYAGGGFETLQVDVKVEPISEARLEELARAPRHQSAE